MITDFNQYNKKKSELKKFELDMIKLIDEFIVLNNLVPNFCGCRYFTLVDLNEYPEALLHDQYFHIYLNTTHLQNESSISLNKTQYDELLFFIKNQDTYRNAKKYNL